MKEYTLCASGPKGYELLILLCGRGVKPAKVYSYSQKGDPSFSFKKITALCSDNAIPFSESKKPDLSEFKLSVLVGWQFLLDKGLENCIVFHDSVLPSYRGFSPTVTALLSGDETIGVSAIRPDAGVDTGPIIAQRSRKVSTGTPISEANDIIVELMSDILEEIVENEGILSKAIENDDLHATYSIWRDKTDYFIDWRKSSEEILRQIYALGKPYEGARAVTQAGAILFISGASLGEDVRFVVRDPGKVWRVDQGVVNVVCGSGTLNIISYQSENGSTPKIPLRTRFLTADNAWISRFV